MTARQIDRVNLLRSLASQMQDGPEKEALLNRANAILPKTDPRLSIYDHRHLPTSTWSATA